jgi:hypothetical protein
MKYWQVYGLNRGGEIPMMTWAIEYEDGTYLTIAMKNTTEGNRVVPRERGWISRSKTFPIDNRRDRSRILKEVPKEIVLEALKRTIETLDLPQEINILKHKFNYAEE